MTVGDAKDIFHHFKLTGEPGSIYKKILIDGKELKGIRSCTICYDVDEVPRVFLEMMTTDIEVDETEIAVLPYGGDMQNNIEEATENDH